MPVDKKPSEPTNKFDSTIAISQTLQMLKRSTILEAMDRQTENRSFTFT